MRAVDLLINSFLPDDLRDHARVYDKNGLDKLLAEIGRRYPEQYSDIVKKISDVGRKSAYLQGETLTLDDFRPVVDTKSVYAQMDQELDQAAAMARTPEEAKRKRLEIWSRYATSLEKQTVDNALLTGNNLGNTVVSGARGNPFQLKAMVTTPALYTDYKDNPIPLFVRRSFAQGLRPYEYLASTFGVRKSVIATKNSVREAGDWSKQASQSAASTIVTDDDCGTTNGLDYDLDDTDLRGRVLAKSYGDVAAGDVIGKESLGVLRKSGAKKIIVRSPLTCQAKSGICAACLGQLPTGRFAPIGYAAGLASAQSLGEVIAQSALNCLMEGTLVRMADGTEKAIEKIEVGELVRGASNQGHTFPVEVTHKWDQWMQPVQRYFFPGCSIECTSAHPLLCDKQTGSRLELVKLPAGQILAESVEELGSRHCWDLTVDCPDHLFVLANGIICSNTKHGGGGFGGTKKTYAGFDVIDQISQSPEVFPNKATVSELDGTVERIEDASQGGKYVTISGQQHYLMPGFEPTVKPGDSIEAGEQLSDGIVDVADIVRLRSLGEARRYYADRLGQAFDESGLGKPNKLNLEIMARSALDHVRIDDPDGLGDYLPDDIASYNRLSSVYSPEKDTGNIELNQAAGKYLQAPALHFTIGTRMTPKMLARIKDAGITHLSVSAKAPKFMPEMVRLRTVNQGGKDWLAKMHTSYLTTNLQNDAALSRDTNVEENIHFAPRLAIGKDFGKNVKTTGMF